MCNVSSANSSINRRQMLKSVSRLFKHRRKIMTRANSLKRSIKQILQLADKNSTISSVITGGDTSLLVAKAKSHQLQSNTTNVQETRSKAQVEPETHKNYRDGNYEDFEEDDDEEEEEDERNNVRNKRPQSLNVFASPTINEKPKLEFKPRDETILRKSNSFSSTSTNNESLIRSPSGLTISKFEQGAPVGNIPRLTDLACPLASEEHSCMSTPSKFSPSIDSICKSAESSSPLSRPRTLNLSHKSRSSKNSKSPSVRRQTLIATTVCVSESNDQAPEIRITHTCEDSESESNKLSESRSPSFHGYLTSTSSLSLTPNIERSSSLQVSQVRSKSKPSPLLLFPPSSSSLTIRSSNLNSPSLNNLRVNEFKPASLLPSPSGYSSSGSCYSKTPLPSPRISKKYTKGF